MNAQLKIASSLLWLAAMLSASVVLAGSKVEFDEKGNTIVNGRRFFPIGIWVYEINDSVMQDIKSKHFNLVIGNGFGPEKFDQIRDNGMMAVPFSSEQNVQAVKDHPALLAWYLIDEPENAHTPENVLKAYQTLKQQDSDHPIGLCHYLFEALNQFKDGCDFTMTDVYPVVANRDVPLRNVGIHMMESRRIHGENWPHWTYIQIFGGPDSDGGKWAQPTPGEVRCMMYIALVARANGILYFSYWPKAPETWAAVGRLNEEITRLTPWLLADGEEVPAKADKENVWVRAKKTDTGWLIIAVNTVRTPNDATISIEKLGNVELNVAGSNEKVKATNGVISASFAPMEVKVYGVGKDPAVAN